MRWRWPRIGREGGLGGWCLCFVLVWSKNLKATARRRRRERDEYSNMSSMFDLLFLIWCLTTPYSYVLTGPEFLCCFYFFIILSLSTIHNGLGFISAHLLLPRFSFAFYPLILNGLGFVSAHLLWPRFSFPF